MSDELDRICDVHFYTYKKGLYCPFCKIESLEKKFKKYNDSCKFTHKERVKEIDKNKEQIDIMHNNFKLRAKEKWARMDNLEEVLRDHIDQHWKIADADRDDLNIIHSWKGKLILLLEKLDAPKEQTEKKEVCEDCFFVKTFDTKICAICIPNSKKSKFKPKDSEKKELPIEKHLNKRGKKFLKGLLKIDSGSEKEGRRTDVSPVRFNRGGFLPDSKLPEPINDYIERTMIDHFHDEEDKEHAKFMEELEEGQATTEPEKFIENDLQIECPQCGWVSEKFRVKIDPKKEKELIEEFLAKLDVWLKLDDEDGIAFVIRLRDEYEGRVK